MAGTLYDRDLQIVFNYGQDAESGRDINKTKSFNVRLNAEETKLAGFALAYAELSSAIHTATRVIEKLDISSVSAE